MKPTALFCISSLGLGHATRTLPVVRSYIASHSVHIASYGNALAYLKKDLAGANVTFHEMKDYPPLERGRGWRSYWYIVIDSLTTIGTIRKEHAFIEKLAKEIQPQFIFSDGRYGSYVDSIPSFILSHQISFVMPRGMGIFQKIADHFNYKTFKRFDVVLVPDFESPEQSLSGDLGRHPMLKNLNHRYIGILSSLKKENLPQDIDFLFTISGYLMEYKESFVSKLLEQAKKLPGKKVFILGNAGDDSKQVLENGSIEIYGSASGTAKESLFNRAKCVVSRAGYTTIMDLVELDKIGFLIPTPGQTEQEYLATHLSGRFLTGTPEAFDLSAIKLSSAPRAALGISGKTETSVQTVHEIVEKYVRPNFISIVIPVHNEEKYLDKTLQAIDALDYPRASFETLVVENGSKDRTEEVARSYESKGFKVYVSEKGASKAKNLGMSKSAEKSDWVVFLDADTLVLPNFLKDLDLYFKSRRKENLSVGTTTVLPEGEKRFKADAWFAFYNAGHLLTKTSFAIQIMSGKYRSQIKFNEDKTFAEDLKFIKDLRKLGSFFYFRTKAVLTSTRRWDEVGWTRLFIKWNWQALVLSHRKKEIKPYDVIR